MLNTLQSVTNKQGSRPLRIGNKGINKLETKKLKFKILGQVKAKQSVKFTRNGVKYTPNDVVSYANWVRNSFIMTYPEHKAEDLKGYYLDVDILVYFKMPESFSKKKRQQAELGLIYPDKKPDWDNISKNICDALNGIAYPDDKAIIWGSVSKNYAESDYVIVEITGFKYE